MDLWVIANSSSDQHLLSSRCILGIGTSFKTAHRFILFLQVGGKREKWEKSSVKFGFNWLKHHFDQYWDSVSISVYLTVKTLKNPKQINQKTNQTDKQKDKQADRNLFNVSEDKNQL